LVRVKRNKESDEFKAHRFFVWNDLFAEAAEMIENSPISPGCFILD
jgi:hypothetical protein